MCVELECNGNILPRRFFGCYSAAQCRSRVGDLIVLWGRTYGIFSAEPCVPRNTGKRLNASSDTDVELKRGTTAGALNAEVSVKT